MVQLVSLWNVVLHEQDRALCWSIEYLADGEVQYMRFGVLTAAVTNVHVFVLMTACRVVSSYRRSVEVTISIFSWPKLSSFSGLLVY
jgi:hypothetical protein